MTAPTVGGPDDFEVSAEGDLDGDGRRSRFARRGWIEPKTWTLHLEPAMRAYDELE
jgi:hypothetical protein